MLSTLWHETIVFRNPTQGCKRGNSSLWETDRTGYNTEAFSFVIFAITASSCLKRKAAKQAEKGRREREEESFTSEGRGGEKRHET